MNTTPLSLKHHRKLRLMLALGTAASAFVATPTLAQVEAQPGDIIVTAQRRAESAQSVPIAITAVSGDDLTAKGLGDISGIAKITPSLNVASYPNTPTTLTLNMRGQGAGDAGQITKDGGVGLYIDGFYIARPQAALFDIGDPERVEVLRGPQGTLYGRNTTGGAVNIISKKPTGEMGAEASLSAGSRNYVRSLTTLNLPEVAGFSVKGTFLYSDKDGWVQNTGGNNYGKHGELAGRVAVRWQPSDDVTLDYAWDHGRVTSTQEYYVNPDLVGLVPGYTGDRYRTHKTLDLPISKATYVDHQLTAEWVVSDSFTVRSLSSYRSFRSNEYSNYSYAFNPLETAGFMPFTIEQENQYRTKQYSQELQLIGSIGERFDITGGLYYFHEKGYHRSVNNVQYEGLVLSDLYTTDREVSVKTNSYAAYAQGTFTPDILEDRLHLTLGARYTRDKKNAARDMALIVNDTFVIPEDIDVRNDQKFSNFSPSVNLAVDWSRDFMTYAKMSKGYKSGGSSEGAFDFRETYGPEKVTSWEAGFKSQFLDRKVTFNVAAFWNEFKDMQIDFVTDPVDTTKVATVNAGEARVRGIEVDLAIQPIRTLSLQASYSYLDTKMKHVYAPAGTMYDPAINPASPFNVGDDVAPYFAIPFAPKHAISASGDWTFLELDDASFNINATYSYQKAAVQSAGAGPAVIGRHAYFNDAVHNLDLRVSYNLDLANGGAFTLTAFAKNLGDSRYARFRTALGSPLTGYTTAGEPWSEPRTVGVEARVRF